MKLLTSRRVYPFLMKIMPSNDSDFLRQLPRDLHEGYKSEKKNLLEKINSKWSDRSIFAKNKDKGIKIDTYHTEVLNACIFPFVQQGSLTRQIKYSYIQSSPLSELGVKNVDFLIASKTEGVLIFGEAKGTITDPHTVISEYKRRIKAIEANFDYIMKMFPETKLCEYVLAVQSGRAVETSKAILRSNASIILWQINKWNDELLSLVVPHTNDPSQRSKLMHSNNNLNKALADVRTSTAFKTFYHESHPVAKMSLLTTIDKGSKNCFTFDEFKACVDEELDNTPDNKIVEITQQIIDTSINIGFVKSLDDATYKIQSKFKNSAARYEELKKKWITKTLDDNKEEVVNNELEKLQTNFLAKKTTLDNF